mmetsp:Transcript_43053/g.124521  ORF Transcript_43053/g.124521 Transcript_43053/m.124521 type:complete len:305 (-) Transcript_43053:530-1444(-)
MPPSPKPGGIDGIIGGNAVGNAAAQASFFFKNSPHESRAAYGWAAPSSTSAPASAAAHASKSKLPAGVAEMVPLRAARTAAEAAAAAACCPCCVANSANLAAIAYATVACSWCRRAASAAAAAAAAEPSRATTLVNGTTGAGRAPSNGVKVFSQALGLTRSAMLGNSTFMGSGIALACAPWRFLCFCCCCLVGACCAVRSASASFPMGGVCGHVGGSTRNDVGDGGCRGCWCCCRRPPEAPVPRSRLLSVGPMLGGCPIRDAVAAASRPGTPEKRCSCGVLGGDSEEANSSKGRSSAEPCACRH